MSPLDARGARQVVGEASPTPSRSRPAADGTVTSPRTAPDHRPDLLDEFRHYLTQVLPPGRWDVAVLPGPPGVQGSVTSTVILRPRPSYPMSLQDSAPQDIRLRVLIADRLTAQEQDRQERGGGSYWDRSGEALLQHERPPVWIRTGGPTLERPRGAGAYTDLRGEALAETVIAILAAGGAASLHDLARRAGVGVATASRVVGLLQRNGLLRIEANTIRARDDEVLLRHWASASGFARRSDARHFRAPGRTDAMLRAAAAAGSPFAISGTRAYCAYRGAASGGPRRRELWLYSERPDELVDALGLRSDPMGGSVSVVPRAHRRVTSDRIIAGLRFAAAPRVAADLLSAGGERADLGELLWRSAADGDCEPGLPA